MAGRCFGRGYSDYIYDIEYMRNLHVSAAGHHDLGLGGASQDRCYKPHASQHTKASFPYASSSTAAKLSLVCAFFGHVGVVESLKPHRVDLFQQALLSDS